MKVNKNNKLCLTNKIINSFKLFSPFEDLNLLKKEQENEINKTQQVLKDVDYVVNLQSEKFCSKIATIINEL